MPFYSILTKTALLPTMRWFLMYLKSLCWILYCCFKAEGYILKKIKNIDWDSILLVLVNYVSFIVRVPSVGQSHTTLQWTYMVYSKQGNYTLVKYCVIGILTDKPKWPLEIWWPCASLRCMGHSFGPWFSLPSSPIFPSFIHLSLRSHLSLGCG